MPQRLYINRTVSSIPVNVIRRLSRYLTYLDEVGRKKGKWIFSSQIAGAFSLTNVTVRHDISYLDNFSGAPKRGYNVQRLRKAIGAFLGRVKSNKNIVMIGVGNLVKAVTDGRDLLHQCFKVCGVFDTSPNMVGEKFGGYEVQSLEMLPQIIWNNKIAIGVIAVSEKEVQLVTDLCVIAGIRGLLNFTWTKLLVPNHVAVIDAPVFSHLIELSCLIQAE